MFAFNQGGFDCQVAVGHALCGNRIEQCRRCLALMLQRELSSWGI